LYPESFAFSEHAAHGPARMLQGLTSSPQRPDCVAGVRGLELRYPCESYVFEMSS
jgi:hypothetical protein